MAEGQLKYRDRVAAGDVLLLDLYDKLDIFKNRVC